MTSPLPAATIRKILKVMEEWGSVRTVLVRRATPYREAGLLVVLLDENAIQSIGPICVAAAQKFTDDNNPNPVGIVDVDERVEVWFQRMEKEKRYFLWGAMDNPRRLFAWFLGQELCEWLVPRLNECGCPCSLT